MHELLSKILNSFARETCKIPFRTMVQGIHVSRRNSELTDSDYLFVTNFN